MLAEAGTSLVNAGPFVGIISQLIMWSGLIACLMIFRSFISNGFSMAIAEYLLKVADNELREKMVRWLGNGSRVMDELKRLDKKLKPEDLSGE